MICFRGPLFHWHLQFPQVFAKGGFDVVLGNPPWERVKLQEQEVFASRSEEIAKAVNAAARKKLIAKLPDENPLLWEEWCAVSRRAEGESHSIRQTGRYPRCGKGDVNTYAIFAEHNRSSLGPLGRAGFIKAIEVHKGKPILYGCGDFLNDYEGIGGYEEYGNDLALMYLATVDCVSGVLASLQMTPMRRRRFRLQRASDQETEWLHATMERQCTKRGTHVELEPDGLLCAGRSGRRALHSHISNVAQIRRRRRN